MNIPQGPWYIDDLLTFTVITTVFSSGVATDADAVPAYRVYEDETGTPILTGNMALLDSANTAGFYSEQITLSAANGFEVGKTYSIHVTATVSSVVGASSGGFKVIAVLATPTNITGGVITTVTTLTNLPAITSNWLTAAGTAADFTTEIQSGLATSAAQTTAQTDISAILVDTAEIGTAGAGLTNINLPNQTMDIVGNITGNLSGSVGSVTGAVGSVTGAVGSVTGAVGSVTGLTAADVAAIKAKTDSLTYTIAGVVDANVQRINDVTIIGDGSGTPFNV